MCLIAGALGLTGELSLAQVSSTVFSPSVYPGNPAWFTCKTPKAWHEHPDDTSAREEAPIVSEGRSGD
jgi:hypothetical protein